MKAVIYGAGNIGRGFIAQVFSQSGYEITFIDIEEEIVEALNRERRFPLRILTDDKIEDIWIEGISAVNGRNEEDAACVIAEADIMATAAGARVLPVIAPVIAAGLRKRFTQGKPPLNIIICENLINADEVLKNLIKDKLSGEEKKTLDVSAGFVRASIGRMVPLQTEEMKDGNPLRVCVEPYCLLPVDKAAFIGEIPPIVGLCPFDNFDFYIKRKLFIHNMGHGICAYLGMINGDNLIYEAVNHAGILFITHNAMTESSLALSSKYAEPLSELYLHISDLFRRFSNNALKDTCARVGTDTVRKLGVNDRFIGAIRCCNEESVNPAFISAGASTALFYYLKENNIPQTKDNACKALVEISGLEKYSPEAEKILLFYSLLNSSTQNNFDKLTEKIIKTAYDMQKTDIL